MSVAIAKPILNLAAITAWLLMAQAPIAAGTSPPPVRIGTSTSPVFSDGRSAVVFGSGSRVTIVRDDANKPITVRATAGCTLQAAGGATALLGCNLDKPTPTYKLMSLHSGVTRPLPHTERLATTGTTANIIAMGSQWIYARQCSGKCPTIVFNWHTGMVRIRDDGTGGFDDHLLEQTPPSALNDKRLRRRGADPYAERRGSSARLIYDRGKLRRTLDSGCISCSAAVLSGWHVAWISPYRFGNVTTQVTAQQVNIVNAKTGRRTIIKTSRFPGSNAGNLNLGLSPLPQLVATQGRIVLGLGPANTYRWTVSSVRWPR